MTPEGFISSKRKTTRKPAAKGKTPARAVIKGTPIRKPAPMIDPTRNGGPIHVPTAELRKQVEQLAGLGNSIDGIASVLTLPVNVLKAQYAAELARGPERANSQVAAAVFKRAVAGDVNAGKFWLKARAGWKEDAPAGGVAINITFSPDDANL